MKRLFCALTLSVGLSLSVAGCQSSDSNIGNASPIAQESKYQDAIQSWGEPAYLPTYLPKHDSLEMVTVQEKEDKSLNIVTYIVQINQTHTSAKEIVSLKYGFAEKRETVQETIKRLSKPGGRTEFGYQEIEKIKVGDADGYWYRVRDKHGDTQVAELIFDTIHVSLHSEKVDKTEFMKIVNSLRKVKPD
ncbi:hypothetical protein OS242_06970 [Tumebacillus sp. DT12]|uniref:PsbP C-terminal domain-containing protein n=1 Tax=Tumebacillus lacus TaxID=2995335 RepID=A0ABT3WYG2_9BACL|nr:hypothetical protein [Tumebacillus lacus]MCX7569702.1 hypothetical protein [Tumebacillus lacus]